MHTHKNNIGTLLGLIDIYYTLDAECVLEICLMMSSDGINFPIGSLRTALKNTLNHRLTAYVGKHLVWES